jgi:hypothetical protein
MGPTSTRYVLRDLPMAPRLVIAAFLLSVGVGYFAALIQLHFKHAQKGSLLPTGKDAERIFSGAQGERPKSKLEHLLTNTTGKFNGNESMVAAFFEKSDGWKEHIRAEREGERLALLDWIRKGADKKTFEKGHPLEPGQLSKQPITADYLSEDRKCALIKCIIEDRCAKCHSPESKSDGNKYPLQTYEQVKQYTAVSTTSSAMSLDSLAQTTHVHLLGFAMLYGLTGLIFSFTSYPFVVRALLAPLPLLMQIVDIACWWLARLDPIYAQVIPITGALVAMGLFTHIVGSLFNLFGKAGKAVVLALLVAGCVGVAALYSEVIGPYLEQEAAAAKAKS